MKKLAFIVQYFLCAALFAINAGAIFNARDLTVLNHLVAGAEYKAQVLDLLETTLSLCRREYLFELQTGIAKEEAKSALGRNIDGVYGVIVRESKMYNAVIVLSILDTERKYYIFTQQELENAVNEMTNKLDINSASIEMLQAAKAKIEQDFGEIKPEMLNKIAVRSFNVTSGKGNDLKLLGDAINILAIGYKDHDVNIIIDTDVLYIQYHDKIEIRNKDYEILQTNKKNISVEEYQAVADEANKHLKRKLAWNYNYTVGGTIELTAWDNGIEYIIMYYPQLGSHVLIYKNKADRLDIKKTE